jgi:hypothetical protein
MTIIHGSDIWPVAICDGCRARMRCEFDYAHVVERGVIERFDRVTAAAGRA